WNPEVPGDLPDDGNLWDILRERDVLLIHPYETFDPVVRMVQRAAEDPDVLAIRQTLYRTSGDSPIVRALELAATHGKDVTVLVELKARFDEARNVVWARRLEDAGCHVLYGIAGLKTHAKALLIVRRENGRLRRYLHLATGNYNDRTAKMYSDLGLMTTDRTLTSDVAAFFNLLTGCSDAVGWERITCEPVVLKQKFLELIDREAELSTPDRPGWILAKMNALEDPQIIEALYRASGRGVQINLNVRGICCLRPGVPDVSERIEVRSIVDRYLEHARIFCFSGGGHEDLYLASADWMGRNLERRFEMLFPITDPLVRRRIFHFLTVYFMDTVKSKVLQPDGTWRSATEAAKLPDRFVESDLPDPLRAQKLFHTEVVAAARQLRSTGPRFRPLHSSRDIRDNET
ncbi:MAG: polyphosphate kinase 1, partial [Planctomycetia bacterium]|nr:polyphosphate kinase 1 [Planctomycetia bacterium]